MESQKITKERLAQYVSLKCEIENQLERLARLRNEEKIPAMRESNGSKHTGGNGDRLEKAILRRIEYEDQIFPQIEKAQKEMAVIENAVNSVSDPMEREVLRLRYLDGEYCRLMPWREVALNLFGDNDESHMLAVYRLHGKALQRLK